MASRSSALRLAAAALHRQNGWLRRNIQIEGESIAALKDAADVTIYTPGSSAGLSARTRTWRGMVEMK